MSNISADERKVRRKRLSTEATSYVAKSEQLNFRLDAPTIERLYLLAEKEAKPVGALVREWVLEKLNDTEEPTLNDLLIEIRQLKEETKNHANGCQCECKKQHHI